jgi:DNA-binding transcriptional regulator YiaG
MTSKSVYALVDPRDGRIHYVGASSSPEGRYSQHMKGVGPLYPDMREWLDELEDQGMFPDLRILHTATPDWRRIEREEQAKHGAQLLDFNGRRPFTKEGGRPLRELLGQNLRSARESSGMTRAQAAAALLTTENSVYRWETASRTPTVHALIGAASAYNTTVADLFSDSTGKGEAGGESTGDTSS